MQGTWLGKRPLNLALTGTTAMIICRRASSRRDNPDCRSSPKRDGGGPSSRAVLANPCACGAQRDLERLGRHALDIVQARREILGIGFFCWLLFTFTVFALPVYVGLTVGIWAVHTGAAALGGIVVDLAAAGAMFGIGRLAVAFAPWV